ncbi:MAG: site-2 protease family protein [Deltaproteobacteria bacterium]|jgi:Zn-dependent protease|nr:site-2 protease family protein [Deltaproteobacteria bacterium]
MPDFQTLAIITPVILLALTAHEFSHAWMANRLGDDTAARAGRLSFNPFRHLDLFGTLVLLITQFIGWAKPVPVEPRNFRYPVRDMSLVALAGPLANLSLAVIIALAFRLEILQNILSLMPNYFAWPLYKMLFMGFLINLGLCLFNLIPLPPLDGFSVLAYFLPQRLAWRVRQLNWLGFILLIILMATGAINLVIDPVFNFFTSFVLGIK